MLTPVKYQLRPAVRMHWASWNDEYVVFDETSGQTHQLDAVRAFVLDFLGESPSDLFNIAAELTKSLAISSSCASELIALIIQEFQTIGLVEADNS